MYLTYTRLDLSYEVSVVSHFMHNSSKWHMDAVKWILAYLNSFLSKGILFSKNWYLDFVSSKVEGKFTSKYLTIHGDNLVTWRRNKM